MLGAPEVVAVSLTVQRTVVAEVVVLTAVTSTAPVGLPANWGATDTSTVGPLVPTATVAGVTETSAVVVDAADTMTPGDWVPDDPATSVSPL